MGVITQMNVFSKGVYVPFKKIKTYTWSQAVPSGFLSGRDEALGRAAGLCPVLPPPSPVPLEIKVIFFPLLPLSPCLGCSRVSHPLHVSSAREKVPVSGSCLSWRGTLSGNHQSPGDRKIWRSRRSRWVCKLPPCHGTWNVTSASAVLHVVGAHSSRSTFFSIWTNWLKVAPCYSVEMCPIQGDFLRYGIWFALTVPSVGFVSRSPRTIFKMALVIREVCIGVSVSGVWPPRPSSGIRHRRLRAWWAHPPCLDWGAPRATWRAGVGTVICTTIWLVSIPRQQTWDVQ